MFHRCKYQVILCLGLLLCVMPIMAQAQKNIIADEVLLLQKRIQQKSLRLAVPFPECFMFDVETKNTAFTDIAIRELHDDNCPGDLATAPIWNRFRVDAAHKIFWYDVVNDRYLPFDQFVKQLRK